jgi:hypothetical protein
MEIDSWYYLDMNDIQKHNLKQPIIIIAVLIIVGVLYYLYSIGGETTSDKSLSARENVSSSTPSNVESPFYSYVLPKGWQKAPVNDRDLVAYKNNSSTDFGNVRYEFSMVVDKIPGNLKLSVTNIVDEQRVRSLVKQVPGATFIGFHPSFVGGDNSVIAEVSRKSFATTTSGQQKELSIYMVQYYVIHNDLAFIFQFTCPLDQKSQADSDFESIMKSISFKYN